MTNRTVGNRPHVRLLALGGRQHGVVTYRQAMTLGVSAMYLSRAVRSGLMERVESGVYTIVGTTDSFHQRMMAACLGAGDGALASHRAAALLLQLDGVEHAPVELSVPRGRRYRKVLTHSTMAVLAGDRTTVDGIPCTAVARTLIDLGAVVDADTVERAVESALRRGATSVDYLRRRLDRLARRGRPGVATLRAVLERRGGVSATESELETRFLQLLRVARLACPVRQHQVPGVGRLDFAYPDRRVAIELDGFETHGSRLAFEHDRSRQNRLVVLGWRVLRFTWADVTDPRRHPAVLAALHDAAA